MKCVYKSNDLYDPTLQQLKERLEQVAIIPIIRNEYIVGAYGQLPGQLPELWVNDNDFAKAIDHLKNLQTQAKNLKSWICESCGTHLEKQFMICWHCDSNRST